jgi:hypothetical protein
VIPSINQNRIVESKASCLAETILYIERGFTMTAMKVFDSIQSRQNAQFGHSVSPQSVFNTPNGRDFDSFSAMLLNEGGGKNLDFCRQYGNDSNEVVSCED